MNFLTTKRDKSFKPILLIFVHALLILTLTGCQAIQTVKETFGKEYRLIDDAFEQLEADIILTFEEYTTENNLTNTEQAELRTYLDQCVAKLHVSREDMKTIVRLWDESQKELGTNVAFDVYVEQYLIDARAEVEERLKEISNGTITLKSAKVERGFLGEIWHFIRNHWLLMLIALGIIGSIGEFVGEKLSEWIERRSVK